MKPRTLTPLQRLGGALLVVLAGLLLVPPAGPVSAQRLGPYLVYANKTKVTCGSASGTVLAVSTSPREVTLMIAPSATTGAHIAFSDANGLVAATTNYLLLAPGQNWIGTTKQGITCIRGGGSDVTAYLGTGE